MEPAGDRTAFEGDIDAPDFMIGVLHVLGVTLDLRLAEPVILRRVGEDRPLSAAVEEGRNEVAFPGRHRMPFFLMASRLGFPAEGGPSELPTYVVEPTNPVAYAGKIWRGFRAAGAEGVANPSLVPFDADGLNDRIQNPTLVLPALHPSLYGCFHCWHHPPPMHITGVMVSVVLFHEALEEPRIPGGRLSPKYSARHDGRECSKAVP